MSRQPLLGKAETINHERVGLALLSMQIGLPELAHDLLSSQRAQTCTGYQNCCRCPECRQRENPQQATTALGCRCDPPTQVGTCLKCGRAVAASSTAATAARPAA